MAKLVSKVYGDALFETAMENDKMDVLYEEACAMVSILREHPEFAGLLSSPQIVKEEKVAIVSQIFSGRVSEELMGGLTIIVEKDRQSETIPILEYFIQRVKDYKKIGIAYVDSAVALNAGQKTNLEQKLLTTTPYVSLEMNYRVDPELIGGLVIRIGDHVVDSSIKTRLYELKKDLLKIQLA